MKQITIIGDVHGKLQEYKKIVDNCESSICVGDFGFKDEWEWLYGNIISNRKHLINPGNHDDTNYIQSIYSTGNWNYNPIFNIFTIRGAESIDKHLRTEGIDWFENEELCYQEQLEAFDKYCEVKPKIVISHDCPQTILESMFKMGWSYGKSQTRTMLQNMFEEYQPELWIFGHHHISKDQIINGTRFICLRELETFNINLEM